MTASQRARDGEQALRARSSGLLIAILALVCVPAWGVVDQLVEPAQARSFILLRLVCEIPILVLFGLLWAARLGRRRPELLSFLILAIVQAEIAWMVVRAAHDTNLYLLGFSLALYGSGCLMGGRYFWTLAVSAVTWLSLGLALLTSPYAMPGDNLTAAGFYLSTASLIAVISHVQRERLSTRELGARRRLEREQSHALTLMARLERLSNEDPLTGLANRRRWDAELDLACAEVRNTGTSLAVLLIDIDHFKTINDRYGHSGGDQALCAVAQLLTSQVRHGDLVARVGGDEYGVLLRGTDAEYSAGLADRIRRATTALHDPTAEGLTLSLGVTAATGDEAAPDDLMRRADARLYHAKLTRNAVAA